jgi:hypothetical protein
MGLSLASIYFEHDDQSQSCYEGADKIVVTDTLISLTLNRNGRNSLGLPKTVEFCAEKPDRDFRKAMKIFTEMRKRQGGDVIHIALE